MLISREGHRDPERSSLWLSILVSFSLSHLLVLHVDSKYISRFSDGTNSKDDDAVILFRMLSWSDPMERPDKGLKADPLQAGPRSHHLARDHFTPPKLVATKEFKAGTRSPMQWHEGQDGIDYVMNPGFVEEGDAEVDGHPLARQFQIGPKDLSAYSDGGVIDGDRVRGWNRLRDFIHVDDSVDEEIEKELMEQLDLQEKFLALKAAINDDENGDKGRVKAKVPWRPRLPGTTASATSIGEGRRMNGWEDRGGLDPPDLLVLERGRQMPLPWQEELLTFKEGQANTVDINPNPWVAV